MKGSEELQLVGRLRSGDEAAVDFFVDEYAPRLFRYAMSRLEGDEELSGEVVQATFVDVVPKIGTFRGESGLFTWLCACCRHQIFAHKRRVGIQSERSIPLDLDVRDVDDALVRLAREADGPEEEVHKRQVSALVHLALDRLPDRYADALRWKYFEGLAVHKIAARLDLSPKAAESVLTRARNAFRQCFSEVARDLQQESARGVRFRK